MAMPACKKLSALFALPLLIASGASHAHPVQIGAQMMNIPTPAGLTDIVPGSPVADRILGTTRFGGAQIKALYLPPAGVQRIQADTSLDESQLGRLVELQVMPGIDEHPVSSHVFEDAAARVQAFMQGNVDDLRAYARAHPELGITDVTNLGLYRQEPWGIFFSQRTHRDDPRTGESSDQIMSSAVISVDHRALILFAYAPGQDDSGSGLAWTQQTLSDWANAIHASNHDSSMQASTLHKAVPWIVLALLLLLGYFLFLKKSEKH